MDVEQRARELLATEWSKLSFDAPVDELRAGCELPPVIAAGVRAIIAALTPPEGYVLVPVEPTEEMQQAAADYLDAPVKAHGLWTAMLAARPEVKP